MKKTEEKQEEETGVVTQFPEELLCTFLLFASDLRLTLKVWATLQGGNKK